MPPLNLQEAQCDGKRKPPWASAARVEVEDFLAVLNFGLVRVAADHGGDACGGGVKVEVGEIVQDVNVSAAKLDEFGWRELCAWAEKVDVSPDGSDGSQISKRVQDGRIAHIAGVEDVVGSLQGVERLGAQQAVGIGDDPNFHLKAHAHAGAWVKKIAERIADKVKAQDTEHDRNRRKNNEMWRVEEV